MILSRTIKLIHTNELHFTAPNFAATYSTIMSISLRCITGRGPCVYIVCLLLYSSYFNLYSCVYCFFIWCDINETFRLWPVLTLHLSQATVVKRQITLPGWLLSFFIHLHKMADESNKCTITDCTLWSKFKIKPEVFQPNKVHGQCPNPRGTSERSL